MALGLTGCHAGIARRCDRRRAELEGADRVRVQPDQRRYVLSRNEIDILGDLTRILVRARHDLLGGKFLAIGHLYTWT